MNQALAVERLQRMLDEHEFTSAYGFRVVSVGGGEATVVAPFLKRWERPGGIVSGQVYMNAADCAMWLAILGQDLERAGGDPDGRTRMVGAASEDEHVRDGGEMGCEQAADRAGADDAGPHANLVRRYCRYGSGSSSDPVTRMSTSLSVYLLPCR